MNSKERLLAALRHEPVDRVPANITYYMGAFRQQHFPRQEGQDPFEANLATETRFGFDPLIGLGGVDGRPWHQQAPGRWEVRQERDPSSYRVTYIARTPAGEISTVYNDEPGMSGWQEQPLIKTEGDLEVLAYAPVPDVDVPAIDARWAQLGERGLGMVSVNGIWQQACYLRGMEDMAMDPYLRPEWTHRFLDLVTDNLAAQAEALCRSQVETFFINESYVGMGLSPKVFDAFVRPYDERLIQIAKAAGKLVLYHDCGFCNALLESFRDMGINYLEPLNPKAASGDIELADVKRRIGAQVCLRGGVNHELLSMGTPADVRADVERCLQTLAPGGGYMLCPAGPLDYDVQWDNLQAFADAAADLCPRYA